MVIVLRRALLDLWHDLGRLGQTLWRDRSVQIVLLLSLLPWLVSLALQFSPDTLVTMGKIARIPVIYWLFARGPVKVLPVRRAGLETLLVIAFVVIWILYRTAEYTHLLSLPNLRVGPCADLMDTIIPKVPEMFLFPLVIFLLLRYTLPQLGLGIPTWFWIPAAVLVLIYLYQGLTAVHPEALGTRTACFYLGAGLPEEFLFRALLLSRLQALFKNPAWGVFISAFIFGASHIPIDLYSSGLANWPNAVGTAFTYQMGIGVALGYAFYRRANVWPLTIIHALIDAAP